MITPKFKAKRMNGLVVLDDKPRFNKYIESLPDKDLEVRVRTWRNQRSNQQNRYYWGVVIELLTDDLGFTIKEDTHDLLGGIFLEDFIKVKTEHGAVEVRVVKSTTSLKITEFEDYLSKVRTWASVERKCSIPLPNEVDF